jgi:hypothetical protein
MSGLSPMADPLTLSSAIGVLDVERGGTNSGTALSGSSVMVSDGTAIVQGPAGTATTVLHGNASGQPTYGAVSLTADVSGILPAANGGTGVNNAGTLTVGANAEISGGGELALDGFTATVAETGTVKMQGLTGTFTLAHNTAATDVTGALFAIATYRGATLDYVITRGSAITRKGTLQIAGDSTSPSVSDTAASVGAAGITWSAVVSGGNIQVQIATDNSVATSIRIRWELNRWLEP